MIRKKDIYSYMNEFPDDKDFEKTVKKYAKPLKDYQELLRTRTNKFKTEQ